jgi:hypothetical protein
MHRRATRRTERGWMSGFLPARRQLDRPARWRSEPDLALSRAKPDSPGPAAACRTFQTPQRLGESLITLPPDEKPDRIQDRALAALKFQPTIWPVAQPMRHEERRRVHRGQGIGRTRGEQWLMKRPPLAERPSVRYERARRPPVGAIKSIVGVLAASAIRATTCHPELAAPTDKVPRRDTGQS